MGRQPWKRLQFADIERHAETPQLVLRLYAAHTSMEVNVAEISNQLGISGPDTILSNRSINLTSE